MPGNVCRGRFETRELLTEGVPKVQHETRRLPQYFTNRNCLFGSFRQMQTQESVALSQHVEEGNQVIPKVKISHFHARRSSKEKRS
jgi:hypothetical protein